MLSIDGYTSMERLGREVVLIMADQLNAEIAAQEAAWFSLDQEYASQLGTGITNITIEQIPTSHMYLGHVPSLINAEISRYPNLSVMAFESQPGGDVSIDLYHSTVATLYIEVMCKSGPYAANDVSPSPGEDLVNRRTQRTIDAVVAVMNRNQTLNGLVQRISSAPSIVISDVFGKHEHRDRGPRFWWQGGRLEYRVERLTKAY
jgi:hypothetical protein